jgi:myo-inositol-hexaphosphate 3-phosphohydrolase
MACYRSRRLLTSSAYGFATYRDPATGSACAFVSQRDTDDMATILIAQSAHKASESFLGPPNASSALALAV